MPTTYSRETDYVELESGRPRRGWLKIAALAGVIILVVTILIVIIVVATKKKNPDNPQPENLYLTSVVKVDNVFAHLVNLENIAQQFDNSRAVMKGYNASVDYVVSQLKAVGYSPVIQYFPVQISATLGNPTLSQLEPKQINYTRSTDFLNMGGYNGQITVTAPVSPVNNFGCFDEDFGDLSNQIALILRGNCTFREKVILAANHSAAGVIIYNDGGAGRTGPFSGGLGGSVPIPVFSIGYYTGIDWSELANLTSVVVSMYSYDVTYSVTTSNVIAETPVGRDDKVIVLGSHLDSVPAGPGINDNGSGTSANLEIAIQMAKNLESFNVVNKVRFCWWGAEEIGLLGSTFYVNNLKTNAPADLKKIALNINIDMIASPNYVYAIYNGAGAAPEIRNASISIQNSFKSFLSSIEQKFVDTSFDGRSDYGPFIENGIPAGGLFTGAEKTKSMQERSMFGGIANAAYDPCYHQLCDDTLNIDKKALNDMSQATASVLQKYFSAEDIDSILQGN